MNKIKILSPEQAAKIAAGEVIERPSNIIKEIIENSIDAKSTQISLYIKEAGKKLIRIVDNGTGMNFKDALLCFANHATSKINSIDDLEQINSFGFRGEALSSINAVSKVTLITKTKSQELGTKIEYTENKVLSQEETSCPVGTDLQVKELFYNIPARKKFLKQDETEWNQILNIFQAFCLSNINIHFKLFKDERIVINAPATKKLQDRTAQLWGHNFSQNLIQLKNDSADKIAAKNNIKLTGSISNHNFWRYGRQQIFFFVNGRYIKNTDLNKALLKGYTGVLPPARFPAGFIFLDVPSDFVDINVHPKKEEVRFLKPNTVSNILQRFVKETLDSNVRSLFGRDDNVMNPNIAVPFDEKTNSSPFALPCPTKPCAKSGSNQHSVSEGGCIEGSNRTAQAPLNLNTFYNPNQELTETKIRQNTLRPRELEYEKTQTTISSQESSQPEANFKIIGQYLKTYIITQNGDNLIILDQHAAHERIIYDEITKNFEQKSGIKLMFPEIINLNSQEIEKITLAQEFLLNQGIGIEVFGKNQIAIKSSPPKIQNQSLKELIFEILEFIKENEALDQEIFRKKLNDRIHAQIACKSAVKAGDILTFEQMEEIVKKLQKTQNLLTCPHGRPTTWILNKHNIEKQFKRKL